MYLCHSSMLICHVVSFWVMVYWWVHIGQGVSCSCHRETHTSWWRAGGDIRLQLLHLQERQKVQVHTLTPCPAREHTAGRALGLFPPCGEMGALKRPCFIHESHHDCHSGQTPPQRDTHKWAYAQVIKIQCLTRCCRNLLKYPMCFTRRWITLGPANYFSYFIIIL